MLPAQLRKLEKLDAPDAAQHSDLQHLRSHLHAAEKLLTELNQQTPAAPAKAADDGALKQAKIELAMKRAELNKAEKTAAEDIDLGALRDAVTAAEQALHAAEAASSKPAPDLVRSEKRPIDEATRTLKTEVAFARADLRKLERDENASADAIEPARLRLAEAERKLHEHQNA
jgi:electron transport complex protein RnfC